MASKTSSDPRDSGGCIELKPSMTPNIEHRVAVKTPLTKKQLINLRCKKGLTEREIAAVAGKSKTRVHQQLQAIKDDPDFKDFQENKALYFENIQHELVKNADHNAIKTMLNKRGMTDAAILEDKIRLIRGQSTNNTLIDVRALIMQVEDERQKTPENTPPPIIDISPDCK